MAKLTIVKEGDDNLRKVCRTVTEITPKIERLLDDMLQTMHDAEGVGLAAPQVTYVMHGLKQIGFNIPTDATTVEEAKQQIMSVLGGSKE